MTVIGPTTNIGGMTRMAIIKAIPYRHDDDDNYRIYPHGIGSNGEGMINRRNPNFYWACDANGHHCHWAWRR
jgi:hypothetical protein